ncbi:ATP-binding protein [Pseudacidovorax sp. RU35E]|uniref:ATP-binding protein n=1 Tax=Pseudacidovorax sp. RU35E TaxID=1907403 RepID=UPI0009573C90|nr:ATP-binding protein [Pseudacidovorax sp. RU35E]SIR70245.1 histidine kinase [Pseudacidovorax sp. RU35E]
MERRVLIHAPVPADAEALARVTRGLGLNAVACASMAGLMTHLQEGAAAALLTGPSLALLPDASLDAWLSTQPAWSDFPFVVLMSQQGHTPEAMARLRELGNVVVVDHPACDETLARAVHAAVRQRHRQYTMRQQIDQLEAARAEVQRLNAGLETRIAERTRELAGANDRLTAEIGERERAQAALLHAQKMEAVGRLTGGIAHDFNNLLHVVQMNLDLLGRLSKEAKVQEISGRARGAVAKGARLTGQLLSFSRKQSLLPRLSDVNALVEGMRELIAVSVGSGVRVELALDPSPCWAVLDASQLEMALINLAVNAREAMAAGGVLTVRTEHVEREAAGGLPAGDFVAVRVQDTGTGIPAGVLGQVFDPFFTTKPLGSGSGLGLSQVYGFARQSGGEATIDSEEGHGTRVNLLFPAVAAPAADAAPPPPEAEVQALASGRSVLVVEDDAEVRRVIADSLALLGCRVTQAEDGRQGLEVLGAQPRPDLMVVDYAMPGMTGAEFIVHARNRVGAVPVVLATGYADMAQVGRVLGTQSILIKPFEISALAACVVQALAPTAGPRPGTLH